MSTHFWSHHYILVGRTKGGFKIKISINASTRHSLGRRELTTNCWDTDRACSGIPRKRRNLRLVTEDFLQPAPSPEDHKACGGVLSSSRLELPRTGESSPHAQTTRITEGICYQPALNSSSRQGTQRPLQHHSTIERARGRD